MSYILEALKKAEHQREIGQVPRIDSEHEPVAAGLSSRWGVIVVLALLVNAGLLLVLFWPDRPTDLPEPVAATAELSPATRFSAAPELRRRGNSAVGQASTPGQEVRPRRKDPPAERSTPAAPPPIPERVSEPAAVMPVVTPVVAPTPPPAAAQYTENLPVWPQVPTGIFEQLHGNLRLDVHVYSEKPQDRFVLINLQKYHEGEQLQEGPVVDAITAEGVVLSLQGQQFLLRAQ